MKTHGCCEGMNWWQFVMPHCGVPWGITHHGCWCEQRIIDYWLRVFIPAD